MRKRQDNNTLIIISIKRVIAYRLPSHCKVLAQSSVFKKAPENDNVSGFSDVSGSLLFHVKGSRREHEGILGKLEQTEVSDNTARPKTKELKVQNSGKHTARFCSMK